MRPSALVRSPGWGTNRYWPTGVSGAVPSTSKVSAGGLGDAGGLRRGVGQAVPDRERIAVLRVKAAGRVVAVHACAGVPEACVRRGLQGGGPVRVAGRQPAVPLDGRESGTAGQR